MALTIPPPTLPPMQWARTYVCPHGHYFDLEGHDTRPWVAWTSASCNECDKLYYGGKQYSAYYSRNEWRAGAEKLLAVATELNQKWLGKPAHCNICNHDIKPALDKAYHLQKHFRYAITQDDFKFIVEFRL